jgi:hypothetical protein
MFRINSTVAHYTPEFELYLQYIDLCFKFYYTIFHRIQVYNLKWDLYCSDFLCPTGISVVPAHHPRLD